ncbi:hypothetical protein [Planococcus salinus]|uniref:Uncharacterized protein n=1 Tax=Planococcus salinus TaxID=1848460 RepID=A0A3M8P522_9BACL|nr:hypothetical protein [Planococcus salinus]RNF38788.1 hypothetical protein EEX84_13250 [Planococcus salinus]
MFIFKRKPPLLEYEMNNLKKFIGRTIEVMLLTREETINVSEKHGLILICSRDDHYIEGSIFQLSDFQLSKTGLSSWMNPPLYTEKHYFDKKIDSIGYIDDEKIKTMSRSRLLVFYSMCELLGTFEIVVNSSNKYKCIWK